MRKFFTNLRKNDRGDQVVGWVILAAFVALVGGALWTTIGPNLTSIMTEVQGATSDACNAANGTGCL